MKNQQIQNGESKMAAVRKSWRNSNVIWRQYRMLRTLTETSSGVSVYPPGFNVLALILDREVGEHEI